MTYTEEQLKANSDEASFCVRPNTIRQTADKHLPIRTVTEVTFDHNSTNHTCFIGAPNLFRI